MSENRKYAVSGFEEYDCVEFIEERPSKYVHFNAPQAMYDNVAALKEVFEEKSAGRVVGIIVSEAIEKGFKPFKKKLRPDQKIRFKKCDCSLTCCLRESEYTKLTGLAEDTGISVTDYIRLAISHYFNHNNSF